MPKNNNEATEPFEYPTTLFEDDYIEQGFTEEEIQAERKLAYEDGQRVNKQESKGTRLPRKQRLEAQREKLEKEIATKTEQLVNVNQELDSIYKTEAGE